MLTIKKDILRSLEMFTNLKLSTKILLGFLAVVVLVGVAGVTGYWGVEKVGQALHRVANEEAQILDAGSEMRLSVEQGKRIAEELKNATSALATDDVSLVDELEKGFAQSTETFDSYAEAMGEKIDKLEEKSTALLEGEIQIIVSTSQESYKNNIIFLFATKN